MDLERTLQFLKYISILCIIIIIIIKILLYYDLMFCRLLIKT